MISEFGRLPNGRLIERIELENASLKVGLISLGASVQSVQFNGAEMAVGSDALGDYLGRLKYAGAIVGRVANRISGARALIAGKSYTLDANEVNGNCLHGGSDGAGMQAWRVSEIGRTYVVFALQMPSGHMGFPGALEVEARYELQGATLCLEMSAKSDADTVCGFAPHGYWNLSGDAHIDDHKLRIAGSRYLPVNEQKIPRGGPVEVSGTEFDFRNEKVIGDTELDHNFCISSQREELRAVAWLNSAVSGVSLEVASTEAGVQIYDARHLGRVGLAIEPQVWPDAVNQVGYPKINLSVGETYRANTEFRFSLID